MEDYSSQGVEQRSQSRGKFILIIGVIIILIAAGAYYYFNSSSTSIQQKYASEIKTCIDTYSQVGAVGTTAKDVCYSDIAVKYKDEEVCTLLSEGKEECVAIVTNNPQKCEHGICYSNAAKATNNASICAFITSENSAGDDYEYMKASCYQSIAVATKNGAVCEGIENPGERDICYIYVGRTIKDATICDLVTDNGNRNACIIDVAYATNNESLCFRVKSNSNKNSTLGLVDSQCLQFIARSKKDLSLCDVLSTEEKITGILYNDGSMGTTFNPRQNCYDFVNDYGRNPVN